MIDKCTDGSYKNSPKKSAKSFEKTIDIKQRIGQNSQLHSFTASQLHSFTASQLKARYVQINSRTIIHEFSQHQKASGKIYVAEAFFIYKTVKSPAQSLQCRLWAASFRLLPATDGGGSIFTTFCRKAKLGAQECTRMYILEQGAAPLITNKIWKPNGYPPKARI